MFVLEHKTTIIGKRGTLTISKPRQRQQLIHADIHQILLLKTLGHDTRIHLYCKHDHIDRTEYFIDLSNLSLIFEVNTGVEVWYLCFGMREFAY